MRLIAILPVVLLCCGCNIVNSNVRPTEGVDETIDTIQAENSVEDDTAERAEFINLLKTYQISPYDSLIVQKMVKSVMYNDSASSIDDYALLINYIYYNKNDGSGEVIWSNLYDMFARYPDKYEELVKWVNFMPDSCQTEVLTQFIQTILYKHHQRYIDRYGGVTDSLITILYDNFPFLKGTDKDLIVAAMVGRGVTPYFALNKLKKVDDYKIIADTISIWPDDDNYLYYPFGEFDNFADFIKLFDKYNATVELFAEDEDDPLNKTEYAKITTPNSLTRAIYYNSGLLAKTAQIINSTINGDLVFDRGIQVGISKQQFIDSMNYDIDEELLKQAKIIQLNSLLDGMYYYFIFDNDVLSKIEIKTTFLDSVQHF